MLGTRLTGKKIAILVEFLYEDLELQYPKLRFREEGAKVDIVGPKLDVEYKGKHGYPQKADVAIDKAKAADYDGIVIPGGFAPDFWRRDERFKSFIRDAHGAGRPIGAICHGPWLLISAKILPLRRIASFMAIKDDVENAGAQWVDEAAVVDTSGPGALITSRTPDDLPDFCRAFIDAIEKADKK